VGLQFSALSQLSRHVAQVHNNDYENFTCKVCGLSFVTKYFLQKHMIVHSSLHSSEENPVTYKCHICDFTSNSPSSMKRHAMKPHEINCTLCDVKFVQKRKLESHMSIFHP